MFAASRKLLKTCSEELNTASGSNGWGETLSCFNVENVKPNERIGSWGASALRGRPPQPPLPEPQVEGLQPISTPAAPGPVCDTWGNNVDSPTQTFPPPYPQSMLMRLSVQTVSFRRARSGIDAGPTKRCCILRCARFCLARQARPPFPARSPSQQSKKRPDRPVSDEYPISSPGHREDAGTTRENNWPPPCVFGTWRGHWVVPVSVSRVSAS